MYYETMRQIQSRIESCASEMASALICARVTHVNPPVASQLREHLGWAAEHAIFAADKLRQMVVRMEEALADAADRAPADPLPAAPLPGPPPQAVAGDAHVAGEESEVAE
jgi:hypothetical protein